MYIATAQDVEGITYKYTLKLLKWHKSPEVRAAACKKLQALFGESDKPNQTNQSNKDTVVSSD